MPIFKHCLPLANTLAITLALTLTPAFAHAADPLLLVTSPSALQAAEKSGASFAHWIGDAPASPEGIATNQALMRSAAWQSIATTLGESLARIQRTDKQAGVGISRYPHRLFDVRWLASPDAFFELVGVANRMDRRPFQNGACGETRLVYRLAYRTAAMQSRLPMTINLELRGDAPDANGSCASAARLWQPPQASMKDEALGRWLVSTEGPLAPQRLAPARIAQVTTNLQSVRWPSAVRPDLGGHAEYMLRAFRWNAGTKRFDVAPLENTPDVARLKANAPLRKELQQWLQQPANLRALDEASVQIPEKFLATESISVAPRGLARLANRPFAQVFSPGEWQAVPGSRTLQSPQAVLRRLDDLSCAGCHQSRAVAGFHLLGIDRRGASRTFTTGNALALPHSPHLQDELARRGTYVRAALSTPQPDPFRPLAEPDVPNPAPEKATVGASCEPTRITQSANPWLDRAEKLPRVACEGVFSVCEKTSVGFPGGMCSGPCDPLDKNGTCGGIAILSDFNQCLAASKPFGECLAKHTRPGNLRSCSVQQPCRDDYICAQAEGQPEGRGACIPPYFLFQMRVDGHS
ncbi:hypothetical protein [Variovorax paradoxus]|uniref:Cytochrome c domain-containing protein n=1 Tax=Variovorax paradoxus (strain EPS) TaxID=595537 RepID=E6V1V1_VARPE|nr:hypothetical protein [Variovorax paradoxus]ADU37954.1 hypothetical protein Varpa_3771 [Variovorax paradoxus EPS]